MRTINVYRFPLLNVLTVFISLKITVYNCILLHSARSVLSSSNMLHWYRMWTQLVLWAASSPPNNLANGGLLVVGPYKVIECGTGSVNIWAAGVWRGSELQHWTLSLPLMLSENKHKSHVFACCIGVEEVCLAARWATYNTFPLWCPSLVIGGQECTVFVWFASRRVPQHETELIRRLMCRRTVMQFDLTGNSCRLS